MTQPLSELTEAGQEMVEEHIEDGQRVTELDESLLREHSVELRGVEGDLEGLRDELENIRADVDSGELEIEVRAAPAVHRHLNIERRDAAIEGLWHWLAVVKFPEFVYHRWEEYSDIVGKFLEGWTNIYSNAIHRLWWIAELTHDPEIGRASCRERV